MRYALLCSLFLLLASCDNATTVEEPRRMVVTPLSLKYAHGETQHSLSITHTCTCPFGWNIKVLDSTLVFQNRSGYADSSNVVLTIDRTKLYKDTLITHLQITSNGYGTDTVVVLVVR
ncbi:MAG: hypothetical protein WCH46_09125 [bacterium]